MNPHKKHIKKEGTEHVILRSLFFGFSSHQRRERKPKDSKWLFAVPPGSFGPLKSLPLRLQPAHGTDAYFETLTIFVAIAARNARSCSIKTIVGENARISCSICIREYRSI